MIITRKEARQDNLKTYFDGEECERGHVAERLTISGRCCECLEEDNLEIREQKESFVAKKVDKQNRAKEALRYIRETLQTVKDDESQGFQTNITNGTDELDILPKSREAAQILGEPFYNTRVLCKNNHNSKRSTRTGLCIECVKQQKEEYKPWDKVYSHERRARFKEAEGRFTKADIDLLLVEQDFKCKYCLACFKDVGYHIDHRIPLAKGGSNWPHNLQILCPTCNTRKGAKLPEQFEREIGYHESKE